jgi:hypothetical protein
MTEDEAFDDLEQRLKRQQQKIKEVEILSDSSIAAAAFIASRTVDELAITTLRTAFVYGYHTGWRDAKDQK